MTDSNSDIALYDAIDRDLDNTERLDHLEAIVSGWIDQLIPELHRIQHPAARWQPEELVDTLRGELRNIRGERWRITHGPVVLDEAA